MAEISKAARHEAELSVYAARHEAGVQAMHTLLYCLRDEINNTWYNCVGDDLIRKQGEARLVARHISLIENGPTIKRTEGV